MRTQSSDTKPEAERVLINLIRKSSVQKRLSQLFSLSSLSRQLSERALARKNPEMNKQELALLFIKLNYGEVLYNKVNHYLSKLSDAE